MSSLTHESMINSHSYGLFTGLGETFHTWRKRQINRRQLAELSERDLHDVGLSWRDIAYEAEKPFWRA
jgi:uncharacterized protein YjiS (DUF1127 family)